MSQSEIQFTDSYVRSSIHHGTKQFGFPQMDSHLGGCVASCIASGAARRNSVVTINTSDDVVLTKGRRNHNAFLTAIRGSSDLESAR